MRPRRPDGYVRAHSGLWVPDRAPRRGLTGPRKHVYFGSAGPTVVQSKGATSANDPCTLTLDSALTVGNRLVIWTGNYYYQNASSITGGRTWNTTNDKVGSTTERNRQVFFGEITTASTQIVVSMGDAQPIVVIAIEVSGVTANDQFNAEAAPSSYRNTIPCGTVTTTASAGQGIVFAFGWSEATTPTVPSGFTAAQLNVTAANLLSSDSAYVLACGSATYTPIYSTSPNSGVSLGLTCSFK